MRTHLLAGRLVGPIMVVGVAVLLAACGSGVGGYGATPASRAPAASVQGVAASLAAAAPASAAPHSAAPSTATSDYGYAEGGGSTGAASLSLAANALGKVVVDGTGMTLYEFMPDNGGAPTCNDACAQKWPPLTTDTPPAVGAGLTKADVGTATRNDGASQVTFHGWPLYRFAGDAAPGNTNGQGLGGKWFVVGTDGNPIK
jgi:predicted lipoprotein with Yx(FWY)xxD motif